MVGLNTKEELLGCFIELRFRSLINLMMSSITILCITMCT
jgi:hypothetical protein